MLSCRARPLSPLSALQNSSVRLRAREPAVAGLDARGSCISWTRRGRSTRCRAGILERLLTYGPRMERRRRTGRASCCSSCRAPARSRPGPARRRISRRSAGSTRSSASSAASHTAFRPRSRSGRERLAALAAALFDRMTEMVLFDAAPTRSSSSSTPSRKPLARVSLAAGRESLEQANNELGLALSRRRDRLPARELPPPRPRSDRRRAHDVRAGELRALPPQDLQRELGHRRQGAGEIAVRDDPQHARAQSARRALRVSRQRGGDRRHRTACATSRILRTASIAASASPSTF